MAIVEIGMSQEQAMEAINPAPAGRYRLVFEGFVMNDENGGGPIFNTSKGGKMVKARFRIVDANPAAHGKLVVYNGVLGSFSFANLCKVLPIMHGTGLDTEGAIGVEIEGDVRIRTYMGNFGKEVEINELNKMYAI